MNEKIKIRHIYKAEELKRFAKLEGKYHHMGETHSGGDTMRIVFEDVNGDYLLQIKENQATILRNAENVAKARDPNGIKKSRAEPQPYRDACHPNLRARRPCSARTVRRTHARQDMAED